MTASFQVLRQSASDSYRPRHLHSDYVTLTASNGEVLLHPTLVARLRRMARESAPLETGGLLAGRILHDERGKYTVVCDAAQTTASNGGPGHLHLSPEETARLRSSALTRWPTCDVVGWWHSHLHLSTFSSTDLQTQRQWTNDQHVGLLIFARGGEAAIAFLGPESAPCAPTLPAPADDAARRLALPTPEAVPERGTPAQAPATARGRQVRAFLAGAAVSGVAAIGALGTLLLQATASSPAAGPSQPAGTVTSWSCVQAEATYDCRATTSSPGDVEWLLDGVLLRSGPRVQIPLPPESALLTVRGTDANGETLNLGSTILPGNGSASTANGSTRSPTTVAPPTPTPPGTGHPGTSGPTASTPASPTSPAGQPAPGSGWLLPDRPRNAGER